MSAPRIVVFSTQSVQPSYDSPRPDRLLRGHPARTTWEYFVNHSAELSCGIWACEPGAWRIQFADNKDEFFCVIEGRVRLHDESGNEAEIGPGEAAMIPAGFRGTFEVLEAVRKYYVVMEAKSA